MKGLGCCSSRQDGESACGVSNVSLATTYACAVFVVMEIDCLVGTGVV